MWCTLIIPALRRPRQEDSKFNGNLNYTVSLVSKNQKKKMFGETPPVQFTRNLCPKEGEF